MRECIAMAYGKWTVRKHKFYYRKSYQVYAVSVGRIISFETDKRYILMTTTEGEERFRATMEQIEEQVRHHGFLLYKPELSERGAENVFKIYGLGTGYGNSRIFNYQYIQSVFNISVL